MTQKFLLVRKRRKRSDRSARVCMGLAGKACTKSEEFIPVRGMSDFFSTKEVPFAWTAQEGTENTSVPGPLRMRGAIVGPP